MIWRLARSTAYSSKPHSTGDSNAFRCRRGVRRGCRMTMRSSRPSGSPCVSTCCCRPAAARGKPSNPSEFTWQGYASFWRMASVQKRPMPQCCASVDSRQTWSNCNLLGISVRSRWPTSSRLKATSSMPKSCAAGRFVPGGPRSIRRATAVAAWPLQATTAMVLTRPVGVCCSVRLGSIVRRFFLPQNASPNWNLPCGTLKGTGQNGLAGSALRFWAQTTELYPPPVWSWEWQQQARTPRL